MSFSKAFQSYYDDGRVKMESYVQLNPRAQTKAWEICRPVLHLLKYQGSFSIKIHIECLFQNILTLLHSEQPENVFIIFFLDFCFHSSRYGKVLRMKWIFLFLNENVCFDQP